MLFWLLACEPGSVALLPPDSGHVDSPATDDTGGSTPGTDDSTDTTTTDSDTGVAVNDFVLTLDPDVVTMVHATWPADGVESWVEYRWEGEDWLVAPVVAPGDAVLLGIPSETEVEARSADVVGGEAVYGTPATITTGSLPRDLPLPQVEAWEPDLAEPAAYAMISVAGGDYTYEPPYWIEIFDREGRVVWYKEVADDLMTFYPTVALDGTHIWFEGDNIFHFGRGTPYVQRQTLDGRWAEAIEVADMGQAVGEGPDGSFFYEQRARNSHGLGHVDPDGTITTVWDCTAWMDAHDLQSDLCDMNTTNWSAAHDSVLASMFESSTVFEIDLATGEPIRQMGQIEEGDPYTFSPPNSMFDYQHDAYWTDAGTLLASTHIDGRSGVQVAAEYEVDDTTKTLTRIWSYVSTDMWATQVGEAVRLPNGNTTQGYGQDGAVREVTPDGTVVWQVTWEKDSSGYRVVGHLSLFDDLYALNVGPG
jgi:hypothetical protein